MKSHQIAAPYQSAKNLALGDIDPHFPKVYRRHLMNGTGDMVGELVLCQVSRVGDGDPVSNVLHCCFPFSLLSNGVMSGPHRQTGTRATGAVQ